MTKNRVKELSYSLFFGLMVLAKGIGLDSGVRLYYVLSAAACLCLGVKLVLTRYNIKQAAAMALLCIIAFVSYGNSGRLGIVLTVLALVGLKDMDIRKLFRMGLVIYGCSFVLTVIMAKAGIIHNPLDVHLKGGAELIRWGMGYSTGNVFHVSYFILTVFLCYTWGKRYNIRRMLLLMAGNLAVFLFSLSYTGIIVTTFFLLAYFYAVKRKKPGWAEHILYQLPLPLCLLFSFAGPFLLNIPLMRKIDTLMQARLSFSAYYLKNQPITLFGARMRDVPNFWVIMDNGYVYIFMTFGIVVFALFCAGYAVLIARYGRGERLQELSIIFSFLLYGIMEQFISNGFMNLSLLFFGELLFGAEGVWGGRKRVCNGEEPYDVERDRASRIGSDVRLWVFCTGIGVVIAVSYLLFVPAKEFVRVPLDSLLYVDAWSVEIGAGREGYTKEELKGLMGQCRSLIERPENMQRAVREAGLEDKMSAEEAAAALEYSLPISVQSSKKYDRFRIRLLELYCGISEEEYARLMGQIVQITGQSEDFGYGAEEGNVCRERIGKSSGEDRIEHISGDKEYLIEKNGSIVRMEHFRDSVFYGIMGTAVSMLLWSLYRLWSRGMEVSKKTGERWRRP